MEEALSATALRLSAWTAYDERHRGALRDAGGALMPVSRGEQARLRTGASSDPDTAGRPGGHEPTDRDLLRRCRAGDAQAWSTLVSRYERLVFSVALRNGVSREDAADVTQSSFVALLDAVDLLRDDERLGSWLMTVARRQSWRIRRRGERELPAPERSPTGDNVIEDWERLTWLHTALRELGDPCRELLIALYFDPLEPSYADIADRLGRAIGGIGPLRARCLARLRMIMEDVV